MPPKRGGKKESKRTLYHILGNLEEFVPPTNCHAASLEDLLAESSSSDGCGRQDDEEDPLTDSNTPAHSGSPFGRSMSPLSPTAPNADPLTARGGKRGGGTKRGRDEEGASTPTPATIVFGGATAERKWGGKSATEEPAAFSDSPMFLTELGMRERVAQRNLESTLYFAESVGNSKEIAPLKELVDWVDGIGVARHLQDIRHMGQLQQLHTLLVGKPFSARLSTTRKGHPVENVAKCHALLLFYLCHQAPLEVVTCPEQFAFMVDLLGQFSCTDELAKEGSGSPSMSFPAPPQLPPKKQSHWSTLLSKGKKVATPEVSSPLTPTPSSDDPPPPALADSSEQSVWSTIRTWIRITVGSTGDTIPMMVSDASILTIVLDTLIFITLGSNRRSLMTAAGGGGAVDPSAQLFGEEGAEGEGGGESQFDSQLSASHMLASMSTDSFSASHQGAITKPGGLLFVGAGGLEVSLRLLNVLHSQERSVVGAEEGSQYAIQSEAPELSKMIQLLEAVSCCEDLRNLLPAHQPLSCILVKIFTMLPASEGCPANNDIYLRRIRVCLNISSVSPQSVPEDVRRCDQMGAYLASTFQSASLVDIDDEDRSKLELCSATVCLIVNLLKRGSNDTMRWSLLHSLNEKFALVAAEVAQRYYSQEGDVSMSVTAGYLAVMLGMLSLGDPDARVTVVTALMNGASESVQTVKHKPMLWIIAILQEFIMFQSTAQILTKNTVVTLTTVVDTLMVENGISVGDGSATPPE